MKNTEFKKLLMDAGSLTYSQQKELMGAVKKSSKYDELLSSVGEVSDCRHCQSTNYRKWGKENGIQRYKCIDCNRTFNQLTNTPLAKLRKKEEWLNNVTEMIKGSSLDATADVCGIAHSTAFRWRHRFLQLIGNSKPDSLSGIVEVD